MTKRLYQVSLWISVGVVPLWVLLKVQDTPTDIGILRNAWTDEIDLFTWWKSRWLFLAAALGALGLVVDESDEQGRVWPRLVTRSLWVYLVCLVVSTAYSSFKQLAFHGYPTYHEGAWALASYVVILAVSAQYHSRNKGRILVTGLAISSAVIVFLGAFQMFDVNPFLFSPINRWVFGNASVAEQFIPIPYAVFSTLMNPNHLGSFFAITAPFFVALFLLEKIRARKIALATLLFAMIPIALTTMSRGAYVGMSAGFTIAILLVRRHTKVLLKLTYLAAVTLGWSMGLQRADVGVMSIPERVASLGTEIQRVLIPDSHRWRHLSISDGTVRLVYDNADLMISRDKGGVRLAHLSGNPLTLTDSGNSFKILDAGYDNLELSRATYPFGQLLKLSTGPQALHVASTPNGMKVFVWNSLVDSQPAPRSSLIPWDFIGSLRGYIWSRTLPVLKKCLWVGKGSGTFALSFPQRDFLGKLSIGWPSYMVVDRPHSFYLQVIHATGGLSLIMLLIVFSVFFLQASPLLKKKTEIPSMILVASIAGVVGYLVTSIFNDSFVGVAPVFWAVLGAGFGLIRQASILSKASGSLEGRQSPNPQANQSGVPSKWA